MPVQLDFAIVGTNFLRLAPRLAQIFFIGDGRAMPGNIPQVIQIPAGATKLYFGMVDGTTYDNTPDWYEDNSGAFTVTISAALFLLFSRDGFHERQIGRLRGGWGADVSPSCSHRLRNASLVSGA